MKITMEAIPNFRDFGGYPAQNGWQIKSGLLFRSGSLARASANDLATLAALRIKTVVDLRTHREKAREPDRLPDTNTIRSVHIPIKSKKHDESGLIRQLYSHTVGKARHFDYDQRSREIYQEFAADFRPQFLQIIKLVADQSNLPILIHCSAGKDRTGFACSLIQMLLGLSFEQAMADYLLSNENLQLFKMEIMKRLRIFSYFGVSGKKFLPLLEARPHYLTAAWDQIRSYYGTVEAYLYHGLDFSEVDRCDLNNLLLEKRLFG